VKEWVDCDIEGKPHNASMSAPHRPGNAKFEDCQLHGPGSGAELLLVEGDSALASVMAVRDERTQAVLALQGKPLNAWVANEARVAQHAQYRLFAQAMGLTTPTAISTESLATLRFDRVALLLDPDADGIHIGALLILYFQRWLPTLIDSGRVWMLRAPMFELVCALTGDVQHADNPPQRQALAARMAAAAGGAAPRVLAHRGLGSIAHEVLRERCIHPATRKAQPIAAADVDAVIAVFGPTSAGA
jgi:DNA gyrase subunit B